MAFNNDEDQHRYEGTLFAQRPAGSDARAGKLFARYGVIFTPVIIAYFCLQAQLGTGLEATSTEIGTTFALGALGLAAFGGDFFGWRFSVAGRWRRDQPALHQLEYFTWAKYPDAFCVRSANGRRVALYQSLRVTTLPTTIHGNFRQFLRQLHSAKTPFSLQVVHVPAADVSSATLPSLPVAQRARDWRVFDPQQEKRAWKRSLDEGTWRTSILLNTWVECRGYLLFPGEIRQAYKKLTSQVAALSGSFASNYPHSKAVPLHGREMAAAAQGIFAGPVAESDHPFTRPFSAWDCFKFAIVAAWGYLFWAWSAAFLLWPSAQFLMWVLFGMVILSTFPSLWPVSIRAFPATYYAPFTGRSFSCLRRNGHRTVGVATVLAGSRQAMFANAVTVGHIALEGYADPNKFLRAVLAQNMPLIYQWEAIPAKYGQFFSLTKNSFRFDRQKDNASGISTDDQVRFQSTWGGFWLATGLIGTYATHDMTDFTPAEFDELRKAGNKRFRALIALIQNNFRDVGLVRLRGILLRAGLTALSTRSLASYEQGGGFLRHLIAGATFAPYIEVMRELKKGLETCVPAEFNTPTNLDNYVVLGNALNTEILAEEAPAGFSKQCLAGPVGVLGGSPHERAAVMQKIALELLARGEGGIAFDSSGAWTGLAQALRGTALWQKVTVLAAGKDFWADPFVIARTEPGYADVFCDACSLIHLWNGNHRDTILTAIHKTEENHLEAAEVAKSLEMLLPERSTQMGDALLAFMDCLAGGQSALFFRSGLLNAPVTNWARSGSLVVLDFSALPEPQQMTARMTVYLYMALLARSGQLSSRVYIDEMEQVCQAVRSTPVNEERFAQWFSLGNLPVVAGVGRVATTHRSFVELFDAAACLQVRNKVDLRATADIMGMGDEAESGLYSSQRKSSYQLEFVQQMRVGWVVVKRSDRPEPFPVVLDASPFARLEPALKTFELNAAPSAPLKGYPPPPPGSDHMPLPENKTLIEHDLGSLAGFAAESLDFLLAAAAAQDLNGGPVSHKLLADQLLYKLQPALFRFHVGERGSKELRDRIMDALAAANYLRTTYRKEADGKETSNVTYEVTPKQVEAMADAKANAGALLKERLAKVEGRLAGVAFGGVVGEEEHPNDPLGVPIPNVTAGALEDSFARTFLPGLAAARVAFLNDRYDESAKKAEQAFAFFIARALGRDVVDIPDLDRDALILTLRAFPEWPFDPEESRILWDEFRPGRWDNLAPEALDRKLNELTAFHERYQLRSSPEKWVPPVELV